MKTGTIGTETKTSQPTTPEFSSARDQQTDDIATAKPKQESAESSGVHSEKCENPTLNAANEPFQKMSLEARAQASTPPPSETEKNTPLTDVVIDPKTTLKVAENVSQPFVQKTGVSPTGNNKTKEKTTTKSGETEDDEAAIASSSKKAEDMEGTENSNSQADSRLASGQRSPIAFPPEVLSEAAKGVSKKDAEENECFDPCFYMNKIPMRQHLSERRPKTVAQAEQVHENEELTINVIAKKVAPKRDLLCKLVVCQKSFLGSGAFSDVYRGTVKRKTGSGVDEVIDVAIKKIWPDPSREDRQITVHRRLKHPNLVSLLYYYVCLHPTSKVTMWTLIMELATSTVAIEQSKYIEKHKIMPAVYAKLFIYQTLCALAYLESKSVVHRDIKPENLLVDMETGRLKIGDFGSAKRLKPGDQNSAYQVTRYYRSPELTFKFTKYNCTVDVWAAGCILAEMLTNRSFVIFYGKDNDDQLQKIFRICGTPTIEQLRECVPGHVVDPSVLAIKYPAADWLRILRRYNRSVSKTCAQFLNGMLRYECNQRLRGAEALRHPYFSTLRKSTQLPNGRPFPVLQSPDDC
ncbi:Protein kinase domain-containing protein [Aphelenchoides besseyi]|nr:Protein kinase domain-containing protein [Aphelenchoides besseyi]